MLNPASARNESVSIFPELQKFEIATMNHEEVDVFFLCFLKSFLFYISNEAELLWHDIAVA